LRQRGVTGVLYGMRYIRDEAGGLCLLPCLWIDDHGSITRETYKEVASASDDPSEFDQNVKNILFICFNFGFEFWINQGVAGFHKFMISSIPNIYICPLLKR
jgi:hypothetical protein